MVGEENKGRMNWLEAGQISWFQIVDNLISIINGFNSLLIAKEATEEFSMEIGIKHFVI